MVRRIGIVFGTILTLLVFTLLIGSATRDRALADQAALPAPLVIDEAAHHLGDQTVALFAVPEPEGTVYTTTFILPATSVRDAFLRLETYNAEYANPVQLNGIEIGTLPGTWWIGWQPAVISVPAAALREGENTLVISSVRLPQWHLFEHWHDDFMFRRIGLLAGQDPFADAFDDGELPPRWDWVDLQEDCAYDLAEQPGALVVNVPPSEEWQRGHDLFWLANYNAPRLLQPVHGDFQIETRVHVDLQDGYQAAGLLAWQDTWHHVRLERNGWWGGSVLGGVYAGPGPQWTYRVAHSTDLSLRLSRVGNTFLGWYREAGAPDWTSLGQATAPLSDTLLVGLAAYNQGSREPTRAAFDHFLVTQLVPPAFTSPCGTTNQVRPTLRGLATAGREVQLTVDGVQVATTLASAGGTFAVSPTVALDPGAHVVAATAVHNGQASSPSPGLPLTVDPGETVDLLGVGITHLPLLRAGPPVTEPLRNRDGCAACDGSGFSVWVPGGKPITVSVPVSATDVTAVIVRIGGADYPLQDLDGDNVYEGTFSPPPVRGFAALAFVVYRAQGLVIEYACGEIIIDPYGVVYDAAVGPKAPISGAVVTLYQQDSLTQAWRQWAPAGDQGNPQTTGSDGRYSFNVVEGRYYITVDAPGYVSYQSQPLEVSTASGPAELMVPLRRSGGFTVYLPFVAR